MAERDKPLVVHLATVALSFFYFAQLGQIRKMKEYGFDVMVAANQDETLTKFSQAAGVQPLGMSIGRSISPLQDLLAIWHIWRVFRRLKPDIVHTHTPKGGLIGMVGSFLAGVKIRLYHMHGLTHLSSKGLYRLFLILCERLSCSLANRVYFVSPSIRDIAINEGICNPKKAIVLCHGSINGVDALVQFNPDNHDRLKTRELLKIPQQSLVIGFVGRVINGKGIRELVQAFDELIVAFEDLHLVVVGPMEEKDAIPSIVRSRILEDKRIRYVGEVADTSPYYAVMDVLAFPTYRDGFGLVAIEAAAMEVPVVATNIPGVMDAVVDSVTGTLVPPADAAALKHALELYLTEPDLRREHGCNGRVRALADFRPEDIWEAQRAEYVDLMKSKQSEFLALVIIAMTAWPTC